MNNSKDNYKAGFVAILGRPNVGKSTLLNALIKDKISIVSPIPQTTRHTIKGILNLKNAQIIFVDTPGMHSFNDKLALHLNKVAKRAIEGCDLIIYVVDTSRVPGREENQLMDIIVKQDIKTIMVLNKIDLRKKYLNDYIKIWKEKVILAKRKDQLIYYLPTSAIENTNIDSLREVLEENIPVSPAYYDINTQTDFPDKFRIADIVREKLFLKLKEELPHSIAVEVQEIENKKKIVYIKASIYVQRQSQKKIIVGKAGIFLKEIGIACRPEIEKIYEKKVFLDIWVKILGDWQSRPRILKELGYWWA